VVGQGSYGLGANGYFDLPSVYAGLDGQEGWIRFALNAPVSSFGAYVNYCPGCGSDPFMKALDQNGNVLESWNLATDAPVSRQRLQPVLLPRHLADQRQHLHLRAEQQLYPRRGIGQWRTGQSGSGTGNLRHAAGRPGLLGVVAKRRKQKTAA